MDYVDVKQLFHEYPQATPPKVLEEVLEALETLRKNDLVFGDLRSPNIFEHYRPAPRSTGRSRLEGKYPADINTGYQMVERCRSWRLSAI